MTYSTIADWKTYAAARGQSEVADAEDDDLTAALLRGSEALDGRYQAMFPGVRTDGRDQERAWPRKNANGTKVRDQNGEPVPSDEVPDEIIRAAYEMALRELSTPGSLSPDVTPGQRVKSTSEAVGPLKEATEYVVAGNAIDAQRPVLTIVEGILAPLMRSKSNVSFIERA